MEKKKKIVAGAVALILLSGCYWVWETYFRGGQEEIQATGTIEATNVNLTAKQAGTITGLTIKAGDTVQKDQLLAELIRNDLVAQRERDQLGVLKAEASLADLQSGARTQEIKEAEANVSIAKANLDRATDDLARLETLVQAGAISQADYDQAQKSWEVTRSQLQAAESRLNLVRAGSRADAIAAAQAEVERNKAVLKSTEAMLEDLKIISPIDGTVLSKNYESGEYVPAGANVATVVNLDDLWIKVYIPTDDLPSIALGQTVAFTVSGADRTFEGKVEEIATKGEYTPKTIQTKKERTNVVFGVKIRISSEGGILKPGMPADVVFARR